MQIHQDTLQFSTSGRNTYNITDEIDAIVQQSGIKTGLCHVFIHHTSASLIITENADPDVRYDLETIFSRLAPDGDPEFRHTLEGTDDMSAHVRNVLTNTEMSIPVTKGRSAMGTWQGLFLWEHRQGHFTRKVTVTVSGN
ncbi:MAG: secondary thiamine-phosphate synthase enzyme YjbQ [Thiotrichaceae bacterium]